MDTKTAQNNFFSPHIIRAIQHWQSNHITCADKHN